MLNLLSNAFKFTFQGSIHVTLTEHDGRIEFSVRDTGTGIPEDEVPHVFERFHRVVGARSRTHEGSGIGLALTSELVRLHQGSITVSSRVGEGSTFTVQIPTGSAHLPQDHVHAEPGLSSTAMGAAPYVAEAMRWLPQDDEAGRSALERDAARDNDVAGARSAARERILVVDDNADMREYLTHLLSGWDVETAINGAAALERIRTVAARPRGHRRDDAGGRRVRAAGDAEVRSSDRIGAGADAVRQGGRRGACLGAGGRCRRLRHQAIQRPRAGRACALAAGPGARST